MRGGEQRGHQVDVAQRGRGEQSRKAACREGAGCVDTRDGGDQVDQRGAGDEGDAAKRHAPAEHEPDNPSEGESAHHGNRRACDDDAHGCVFVALADNAHGEGRGDRPEYRVGGGHQKARADEKLEGGRRRRGGLTCREQSDAPDEHVFQLEPRRDDHEGDGGERHRPGVDGHDVARLGLGYGEAVRYAHEKSDGYELGRVHDERGECEPEQGYPACARHGLGAPFRAMCRDVAVFAAGAILAKHGKPFVKRSLRFSIFTKSTRRRRPVALASCPRARSVPRVDGLGLISAAL